MRLGRVSMSFELYLIELDAKVGFALLCSNSDESQHLFHFSGTIIHGSLFFGRLFYVMCFGARAFIGCLYCGCSARRTTRRRFNGVTTSF